MYMVERTTSQVTPKIHFVRGEGGKWMEEEEGRGREGGREGEEKNKINNHFNRKKTKALVKRGRLHSRAGAISLFFFLQIHI